MQFDLFNHVNLWNSRTGYKMANRSVGYRGKKFDEVCFQYQLRKSLDDNRPRSNIKTAVMHEIPFKLAQNFILKYEWLGTLPVNYNKFCGLYFGSALAGVTCFVEVKFGGKFTLYNYPAVCLGRGACVHWCPEWGGSYLIQNSLKLLYAKNEPIYVVAFSDWDSVEILTLYQACKWTYLRHKDT